MKILIATGLYPPEIGGPATYSKCLKESLPLHGIDVSVLPFSQVRRFPKIIRHVVYFFLVLREGWSADIIYAQDPVSVGLPAYLAAFCIRKKFLLKVVGDYAWEQATQRSGFTGTPEAFQDAELPFVPRLLRALERFVSRRAVFVVVPSNYLGKIVRTWGVPPKKIHVIYNGIEEFGDTGNKQVLRGLLKFHGKLLISVGRLVSWKGFKTLIQLLPTLKIQFPDIKLLIVGSGPDFVSLEAEAEKMNCADDVIFTGALPRDILIRYLRASDLFILNTSYEGLSHQILETMMVGVPVVSTNVGGNPEVIEHAKNGFLTNVDDRPALTNAISLLLGDMALRMRIIAAGKRTAQQFSNKKMIKETVAFLENV